MTPGKKEKKKKGPSKNGSDGLGRRGEGERVKEALVLHSLSHCLSSKCEIFS